MDLLEQRIDSRLQPAVDHAAWIAAAVSVDTVDLNDTDGFDKFVRSTLHSIYEAGASQLSSLL